MKQELEFLGFLIWYSQMVQFAKLFQLMLDVSFPDYLDL